MRAGPYHTRFSFLFARVRAGCQQEPVFGDQRSQSPTRRDDGSPEHKMSGEGTGSTSGKHIRSDQHLTPSVCAARAVERKKPTVGVTRHQRQQQHPPPPSQPPRQNQKRNNNTNTNNSNNESSSKLGAQVGDYSLLHVQQPWLAWPALMLVKVRCSEIISGSCVGVAWGVGCVMGMVMRQRLRCSVLLWRTILLLFVVVQKVEPVKADPGSWYIPMPGVQGVPGGRVVLARCLMIDCLTLDARWVMRDA